MYPRILRRRSRKLVRTVGALLVIIPNENQERFAIIPKINPYRFFPPIKYNDVRIITIPITSIPWYLKRKSIARL